MKTPTIEDHEAANKACRQFLDRTNYATDVPRFTVQGMNQAELLVHVFTAGFLRGVDYERRHRKNK